MIFLLDTHLLLWASSAPNKLPTSVKKLVSDLNNQLYFSSGSLWEIIIKNSLGRPDFQVNAHVFRRALLDNDYQELNIRGDHVAALDQLPPKHKDPFDRILLAQAIVEGMILVTADTQIAQYEGPIQFVRPEHG